MKYLDINGLNRIIQWIKTTFSVKTSTVQSIEGDSSGNMTGSYTLADGKKGSFKYKDTTYGVGNATTAGLAKIATTLSDNPSEWPTATDTVASVGVLREVFSVLQDAKAFIVMVGNDLHPDKNYLEVKNALSEGRPVIYTKIKSPPAGMQGAPVVSDHYIVVQTTTSSSGNWITATQLLSSDSSVKAGYLMHMSDDTITIGSTEVVEKGDLQTLTSKLGEVKPLMVEVNNDVVPIVQIAFDEVKAAILSGRPVIYYRSLELPEVVVSGNPTITEYWYVCRTYFSNADDSKITAVGISDGTAPLPADGLSILVHNKSGEAVITDIEILQRNEVEEITSEELDRILQ